jgi:hypothetical protein
MFSPYSSGSYQDLEGSPGKGEGGVVGVHPFAMTDLSEHVGFLPVPTHPGFYHFSLSQEFTSVYCAPSERLGHFWSRILGIHD